MVKAANKNYIIIRKNQAGLDEGVKITYEFLQQNREQLKTIPALNNLIDQLPEAVDASTNPEMYERLLTIDLLHNPL